jgi:hypothetical protein
VIKGRLRRAAASAPLRAGGCEHAVSEYATGVFWRSRNCEIMLLLSEYLLDVIRVTQEIYGTREKVQPHDVAVIAGASLEQTHRIVLAVDEVTREKVASRTGRKL